MSETLSAPSRPKNKTKRAKKKPNWQPFVDTWARRTTAYEKAQQTAPFVTPTSLKRQEEAATEAGDQVSRRNERKTPALLVGDLAHRFLQSWQFTDETKTFAAKLRQFIDHALPQDFHATRSEIESELQDILASFFSSNAYAELKQARILGREVPLLMPWNSQGQGQIMEGVIDLIYEQNGLLYLADYKTDRIDKRELAAGAERYRQQAEIYCEAAQRSLGREIAAFKLFFLRLGDAVELKFGKNQELTLF